MKLVILFLLLILFKVETNAWVYPEHREIALRAIELLDESYRVLLDKLWSEARTGFEFRLSESVILPGQSTSPQNLDFASWPAIAGDHSCSPENMLDNILRTDWIMKVANITAQLKIDLENAETGKDRINALRDSDLSLQFADPEYATRAGSNNAHFLIALDDIHIDSEAYTNFCIEKDTEVNAIGIYVWYHYRALKKINILRSTTLSQEERSALILSALADEAFAIHFLEDVFAAGHVAGTWGDESQRKGTHDYYNEHGLKTATWDGEQIILTGDAWMRNEDAERAARVIKLSFEQLLEAANGNENYFIAGSLKDNDEQIIFDVCSDNYMPSNNFNPDVINEINKILKKLPVPGLGTGLGETPRFRAELGLFVGFSPALRGSIISRGFASNQETIGLTGGLEAAVRFGVGLEGVLNESGDGLVFLEAGWSQSGASTNGVVDAPEISQYGNLFSAIPGRSSITARLRIPFYLIPGDLLIAGPILFFVDPEALNKMGVTAVNGGLVPWQVGIATSFGRFQFVLGREIGVFLSGRTKGRDAIFVRSETGEIAIMSYRSTRFEFPILEYQPFRSFATDQSSSMLVQLYGGVDIPHNEELLFTLEDFDKPDFEKIWYFGARLIFDWRHYF